MKFSIDATYLEVNVFHSMACYLVTKGGVQKSYDERNVLFPCFTNLCKGGASYKVHKAMQICIERVPGVNSELTPSGILASAADQMYQHPILNISGERVHGYWSFEGESRLFNYMTNIACESSWTSTCKSC